MKEGIDNCPECHGSGWSHREACMKWFMKPADKEWGYCREDCGSDECYKRCSSCWEESERRRRDAL